MRRQTNFYRGVHLLTDKLTLSFAEQQRHVTAEGESDSRYFADQALNRQRDLRFRDRGDSLLKLGQDFVSQLLYTRAIARTMFL